MLNAAWMNREVLVSKRVEIDNMAYVRVLNGRLVWREVVLSWRLEGTE